MTGKFLGLMTCKQTCSPVALFRSTSRRKEWEAFLIINYSGSPVTRGARRPADSCSPEEEAVHSCTPPAPGITARSQHALPPPLNNEDGLGSQESAPRPIDSNGKVANDFKGLLQEP